ncbi:hypothetical protein E8E12_008020 [Didymella heteroderae]|uniref:Uncharacterized protein n=1 Tax=Didymella heteroderae TaxID=1769908 RepID=A0A9P4WVP5_9PLEO|nr:hypothetical protein E8E12_008020 [Didymella heteroderae]
MGQPRKRRREGEDVTPAEQPATTQHGHDSSLNGFTPQPSFSSFGLISPPEFADLPSGNEVYAQAQLDPSLVGIYGPSPPMTNLDFGHTPPIDPTLWDPLVTTGTQTGYQPASQDTPPDQTAMGPCTCLSLTYLTLTDLQTVPTFSFPQVIIPLRKAMTSISSLTHCPICPLDPFSAIQNVSSIVSLFKAIVERFSKVLHEIDRECERLRTTGGKKPYRIGDNNPHLAHLHTGTLDCPMGFNVELEPDVWRTLVKTALKGEVEGGGSNPTPLKQLVEQAEARQRKWHSDKEFLGEEGRRLWPGKECDQDNGVCESLGSAHIRRAIESLDWS